MQASRSSALIASPETARSGAHAYQSIQLCDLNCPALRRTLHRQAPLKTRGPSGTLKNLTEILPFSNTVVLLEVDGKTLQATPENGVSQVDKQAGRFLQVSGICYRFDPKAAVRSRVSEVKIGGQALDPAKTYKLAVGSFAAGGGDGYTMLQGVKTLVTAANVQRDVVALTD